MQQIQDVWAFVCTNVVGGLDMAWNPVRNARVSNAKSSAELPELRDKVCVITGGNAGIGFATAKLLRECGARVIIACRDKGRAEAAAKELNSQHNVVDNGSNCYVEVMDVDLASFASVREFCQAFNKKNLPLHYVLCNAGLMAPPDHLKSKDGLEMQLQVNYLSHWLLLHELLAEQRSRRGHTQLSSQCSSTLPLSTQQPPSQAPESSATCSSSHLTSSPHRTSSSSTAGCSEGTRVVLFSSVMHRMGRCGLTDPKAERRYIPTHSYGFSKLAAILAARELQQRFDRNPEYGPDTALALHPGVVNTHLANNFFAGEVGSLVPQFLRPSVEAAVRALVPVFSLSPDTSARYIVQAMTGPREEVAGRYLAHGQVVQPDKVALDDELCGWLWEWSARLTGTTLHPSLL